MCNFASWIEHDNKVYFLTGNQVFNTLRGKALQEWCRNPDDHVGHGAIRYYYDLAEGVGENKECENFSKPGNFPPEIVKALKNGAMRGAPMPRGLLIDAIYAKCQPELDAIKAKWQAELDAIDAKRQAKYDAIKAKWQPELNAIYAKFWDLFAIPENRAEAWR